VIFLSNASGGQHHAPPKFEAISWVQLNPYMGVRSIAATH